MSCGAPPGTRTPNPRIKSPNPVMSPRSGACQPVLSSQVSVGGRCRRVPAGVGCLRGHRAPIAHRRRQSVLHLGRRGGVVKASKQRTLRPLAVDHAPSGDAIGRPDWCARSTAQAPRRPGTTSDFADVSEFLARKSRPAVRAEGSCTGYNLLARRIPGCPTQGVKVPHGAPAMHDSITPDLWRLLHICPSRIRPLPLMGGCRAWIVWFRPPRVV